jgi:hypothetical protein
VTNSPLPLQLTSPLASWIHYIPKWILTKNSLDILAAGDGFSSSPCDLEGTGSGSSHWDGNVSSSLDVKLKKHVENT